MQKEASYPATRPSEPERQLLWIEETPIVQHAIADLVAVGEEEEEGAAFRQQQLERVMPHTAAFVSVVIRTRGEGEAEHGTSHPIYDDRPTFLGISSN